MCSLFTLELAFIHYRSIGYIPTRVLELKSEVYVNVTPRLWQLSLLTPTVFPFLSKGDFFSSLLADDCPYLTHDFNGFPLSFI